MILNQSRPPSFGFPSRKQAWRWLIPLLLAMLFLTTLIWLPLHEKQQEASERQEQLIADSLWVEQTIRFQLQRNEESLNLMASEIISGYLTGTRLQERMANLIRNNHEIHRIIELDVDGNLITSTDETLITRNELSAPSKRADARARATRTPMYSQPAADISGPVMFDYHVPLYVGDKYTGSIVASYLASSILDDMVPWWFAQDNEIALTDINDVIIHKRASGGAGRGVYTHRRALNLAGVSLKLSTNSTKSAPKLLPSLLVDTVILLALGLAWSLTALWRDINRRLAAEMALREQIAFRTAMENSLITGLRARDLDGRVTYVNPAFSQMVGIAAEDIVGHLPPMPYWAPEAMGEYQRRFSQVVAGTVTPQGFETVFQHANGERIPVLIFESPLVDDTGQQTGWMGSILDISDRKRVEDLNRQQQEKLQASARLATMGEIASTLAHELNQPLAAISSYTAGALNILAREQPRVAEINIDMLTHALEKANAQAQRAGQIIRSVHTFVKKREPMRTAITLSELIESVAPLVELQAQKYFVAIKVDIPATLPTILADQVLLEQVLLNLTRNAIESMQSVAPEKRVLRIAASVDPGNARNVVVSISDQGHGIPQEVAERLYSPFFSTKADGMGMGLSICRTAIEFHGGTLTHVDNPGGGTIFRFSLPALQNKLIDTTMRAD
ncbi:two-component system sensor histidine kinase NtrB [Herminiimonas fonticola]|uniref:histidine kinase n=1 Tax=Herminiimonas fonticola TaxID=303380 RepID=A0A4R6G3T5_9BURK|nr:ATP-binding protein [Herminiimonas fonticola]RBA23294.1 PAS domain S-box protein [Herminiimonas fonticola]TDN89013.1 PAS/PAC sensor signal transduction histidine kinase [Herminiimonas fonticola]